MVHKVPEEEAGAGGRELLHDQASKLPGLFGLLANALNTPNFFWKVPKFWEPSENFGRFRNFGKLPKFLKVPKFWEASENFGSFRNFVTRFRMQDQEPRRFWNILRTTTIKKTSVSYIVFRMGPKPVLVVKNLLKFSEIWEDVLRLPKIPKFR